MALQAGDVFGRYELVSWLGRGGMAETWRAQLVGDAGVTKPVLIKKVLPEYADDEAFISMFISEARISATLSHGNVAQVFDFGRVDGEYFLAMEFVDGQPLHRVLKRAMKSGLAALPVPVAVFIAMEMCRGLHYAHSRTNGSGQPLGIVHRDISPDNVLVGYEGQVKIVDFGIAKAQLLRGFKTAPGVVKGKYLFFSPEQARGEDVDARTDVWATGVVLYELLCGKLPVEGPPHVVMMRVGRGEIPAPSVLRSDLPKELNDIVMKALTPDREARFESSHAFGDALAGFLYSNFPRFSAMTIANLLRVLFRGDLAQEGRELSVPGSFLEEMKSWREPTVTQQPTPPLPIEERQTRRVPAVKAPVAKTTEHHQELEASLGMSRRMIQGFTAGGLLTVGACLWLLLDSHSPPPAVAAPPPIPFRPTVAAKAVIATQPPRNPVVEIDDEATSVRGMLLAINRASRADNPEEALKVANRCTERYPNNPNCKSAQQVAQSNLDRAKEIQREQDAPKTVPHSAAVDNLPALATAATIEKSLNEIQTRVLELNKQGNIQDALEIAQACADRAPKVPECHLMLGVLYAKNKNFTKSEQHYERFVMLAPPDHPKRKRVVDILSSTSTRASDTREPARVPNSPE
ncbi:serine/threonine protein kinase [Corallococcus sp. CA047B]|uniref:serine/threonine protein kinase n=1 Tax=Corallococcus sp. CA047B TaxID=2316729 RepID=UPI000EA13D93|nr:serine/threonine-protein kinase [Corallococcus sp. CA047B]RKH14381.1 serine/threonine protein kinase [Corallococcus sp. CA047B]